MLRLTSRRLMIMRHGKLLGFAKRNKRECMNVKVDLQKAYDYVPWDYVRYMMR